MLPVKKRRRNASGWTEAAAKALLKREAWAVQGSEEAERLAAVKTAPLRTVGVAEPVESRV